MAVGVDGPDAGIVVESHHVVDAHAQRVFERPLRLHQLVEEVLAGRRGDHQNQTQWFIIELSHHRLVGQNALCALLVEVEELRRLFFRGQGTIWFVLRPKVCHTRPRLVVDGGVIEAGLKRVSEVGAAQLAKGDRLDVRSVVKGAMVRLFDPHRLRHKRTAFLSQSLDFREQVHKDDAALLVAADGGYSRKWRR